MFDWWARQKMWNWANLEFPNFLKSINLIAFLYSDINRLKGVKGCRLSAGRGYGGKQPAKRSK